MSRPTLPLEEVRMLHKTAQALTRSLEAWEKIAANSNYDKTGLGFNLDDRFKVATMPVLRLDCWAGVYGNSGCSTAFGVGDEKTFTKAFGMVLNRKIVGLLKETRDLLMDEVRRNKDVMVSEAQARLKELEDL